MTTAPGRALLLFLDGVGIGPRDPRVNPLLSARMPHLRGLLGGRLPVEGEVEGGGDGGAAAALAVADATLQVAGRPQSGTGQTTLLTGINAAARLGRHFGPWVPTELRALLAEENLLTRAVRAGRSAAFANAYPAEFIRTEGPPRRPAAPPLAARAAGLLVRDEAALRAGRAVASEIDNQAWRARLDPDAPPIDARAAGRTLARICAGAEVTLFAHYATDLVGHRGDHADAVAVLERVDRFLGALLSGLPPDALLVVASDHGNVEDLSTRGHTLHPVPVIAHGPGAAELAARVRSIADVVPAILHLLSID